MMRIPIAPLILGLAGLIPFLWGAATHLALPVPPPAAFDPISGQNILAIYGLTILAFMSGCLWAFSTRSPEATAAKGYVVSVLPALWGAVCLLFPNPAPLLALTLGFAALLPFDLRAVRLGEAPEWWFRLRLILTTIVVACLMVGALA